MSTSGPWVSADEVIRPGDIWNSEVPLTFNFSGGFALSGGGAVGSVTLRKQAQAFTPAAFYGQADYGTAIYGPGINLSGGGAIAGAAGFTSTFALSGGGATSATGRRGAVGSLSLPGGGALTEIATRGAFAVMAEDTYGQGQYGSAIYGPGVLLHGGGTVAGNGKKNAFAVTVESTYAHATYGNAIYGSGVLLHGGGAVSGSGGSTVSFDLAGGGATAGSGAKHAREVVAGCTYGQSTYGSSFYGPYIPLVGGGDPSVIVGPRRYSGVVITGGGAILIVGHKAALSSNVENCYGQAIYGVGVYSTALHIHGGGALTTAGVKRAQVALVQTGGGTPVIVARKIALVAVSFSGGGASTGQGEKHAFSHSAGNGYGVAIYGVATYSSLPGVYGAAIYGVATYSPTYNSYGVAIYGAATYGSTDTSILHIHGGGRLYGPFPYVLTPRVRVVNSQGLVHIRTGQAAVKVNTSSVRITVPA